MYKVGLSTDLRFRFLKLFAHVLELSSHIAKKKFIFYTLSTCVPCRALYSFKRTIEFPKVA